MKLSEVTTSGYTHVIYVPAKIFGGRINASIAQNLGEALREQRRSIEVWGSAEFSARLVASQKAIDMMGATAIAEANYVPQLPPQQDVLTFVVIILVFFSEWTLFAAFLAEKFWARRLRRIVFTRSAFQEREQRNPEELKKLKKRLQQSCALLVPAATGFVPLIIGLNQARDRKNAAAGVLSSAWVQKTYQNIIDQELESLGLAGGRAFSLALLYEERSEFTNLHKHYIWATCVAIMLLSFSVIALVLQGLMMRRLKPSKASNAADELLSKEDLQPS